MKKGWVAKHALETRIVTRDVDTRRGGANLTELQGERKLGGKNEERLLRGGRGSNKIGQETYKRCHTTGRETNSVGRGKKGTNLRRRNLEIDWGLGKTERSNVKTIRKGITMWKNWRNGVTP